MTRRKKLGRAGAQRAARGYVLLTLLLFIALLTIVAAVAAPSIAFRIKRDREEELVHRGVQYSRAIRNFSKKNGRYPARLEELQDASGVRFIRKLYKDPITGRNFKLLHMADLPSQGGIPNLNSSNSQASENAETESSGNADATGNAAPGQASDSASPSSAAGTSQPGKANTGAGASVTSASPTTSGFKVSPSPDVQPGLLIFGVASSSKAKTIREFNRKNHYNDWLFFYDPKYDRGFEIRGPTNTSPNPMLQPPSPGQSPSIQQP
jgi:type II secretory pathway pseudopilin PulG